ncbi:MAG: hypothetical protein H6618_00070 [Deltaproteobacteria bacterium]|nr:hypothetical protein [Deltaproteobacteria bacterium]
MLKRKSHNTPGIITFTHNEVLFGIIRKYPEIRKFLKHLHDSGQYRFGVHIQGYCGFLREWPVGGWESFWMWSDPGESYLHNLPQERIIPLTCANFLPAPRIIRAADERNIDIMIISRPSDIKRIGLTMEIMSEIYRQQENLRTVFIVPDSRRLEHGVKTYQRDDVARSYFEAPLKNFSCRALKNISFISSANESFGMFPLEERLVQDVLGKSRFMLLTSRKEGTPRVLVEALMHGVRCFVSEDMEFGFRSDVADDLIWVPDCPEKAAGIMMDHLTRVPREIQNPERYQRRYSCQTNIPVFTEYLQKILKVDLDPHEMFLEDLHLRLACHGQKSHFQFYNNPGLFMNWLKVYEQSDPYDEDPFLDLGLKDRGGLRYNAIRYNMRSQLGRLKVRLLGNPV